VIAAVKFLVKTSAGSAFWLIEMKVEFSAAIDSK